MKTRNFQEFSTNEIWWVDDLMRTVLNLAYKLGMSPSHIAHHPDKDNGCCFFVVCRNKWSKYLVLLLSIATALFACISTSSAISRASIRSPSIIFMIAPDVGDNFLCFMFWYLLWTRQKEIAVHYSLLTHRTQEKWRLPKTPSAEHGYKGKQKKYFFSKGHFLVTLCCILTVLLIVIFDMLKIYNRVNQHPTDFRTSFLGILFQEMRQGLLLDDRPGKQFEEMKSHEVIIAVIYLLFTCYFRFVKALATLLCVAGVLAVFKNASDFKNYLEEGTSQSKIVQAFQAFQEFLDSINQIIGPLVFGITIVCTPTFFVANLASFLLNWNLNTPSIWLTIGIQSFIMMFACEIPNQIEEFREWILKCGQGPYENQLFAIFVDLTQNPLGVQGMECFTVTYTFQAQMMSAVVNFTIILLQFVGQK